MLCSTSRDISALPCYSARFPARGGCTPASICTALCQGSRLSFTPLHAGDRRPGGTSPRNSQCQKILLITAPIAEHMMPRITYAPVLLSLSASSESTRAGSDSKSVSIRTRRSLISSLSAHAEWSILLISPPPVRCHRSTAPALPRPFHRSTIPSPRPAPRFSDFSELAWMVVSVSSPS